MQAYGTADYYVQKLFSLHKSDRQLTATVENAPEITANKQDLHASATLDKKSGEVIIKVVNITDAELRANVVLHGVGRAGTPAKVILLRSDSLDDENSLQEPKKNLPAGIDSHIQHAQLHL